METRKARSLAILCIAAWLAGTIGMAVVATQNFYIIDPLLKARANPSFAADLDKLGYDETRALFYYLSSEINRLYFQYWNIAQLLIGLVALWLVVKIPDSARPKWYVVAMLGIVLFLTVLITPRIITVGRSIDFVPRTPPPSGLRTFGLLHAAYTVFDGIELILGVMVAVWLVKAKD